MGTTEAYYTTTSRPNVYSEVIDLNDNYTNCDSSQFDSGYNRIGATGGSLSNTYNYGYICGGSGLDGSYENMCTFFSKNGFEDDYLRSTHVHAASTVYNGSIYFVGNNEAGRSMEVYNLERGHSDF